MKIRRISRLLSVALLLTVFLYGTAVRELHYVFSVRYHTEAHDHRCDHHIHPTTALDDCSICKVDVNHVYDHAVVSYSFSAVFLPRATVLVVRDIFCSPAFDTHPLRGPPVIS